MEIARQSTLGTRKHAFAQFKDSFSRLSHIIFHARSVYRAKHIALNSWNPLGPERTEAVGGH